MPSEKQQLAQQLYLHTDRSQAEIAEILNVNRKTLYLWIRNGKWEQMKIAARQSPGSVLQSIYNHIDEVNKKIARRPSDERCPSMHEVEMLRKLVGMTKVLGNTKTTGTYIEVFEELIRYVSSKDSNYAKSLVQLTDKFLKGTILDNDFYIQEHLRDLITRINEEEKKEEDMIAADPRSPMPDSEPPIPGPTPANSQSPIPNSTKNGAQMGHDGACFAPSTGNTEQSAVATEFAPVATHEETNNTTTTPQCPIPGISANGASTSSSPTNPEPNSQFQIPNSEEPPVPPHASLPPSQRPSPFRDGDILWVNYIDDVDERLNNLGQPWGQQKMGDKIRLYPDFAEARRKKDNATYQARIKMDEEDRIEKEKADKERKEKWASIITNEDYYKYYTMLRTPCTDISETIVINGKERNRMAFEYNLRQMKLHESERSILTDGEYFRHRATQALYARIRRNNDLDQ